MRSITVQNIIDGADITVSGDPGPCRAAALVGCQTQDPQATPSPSRYIMAVCRP